MNNYLSKINHKKLHIPNMSIFLLSKLCRIYYAQKGITFYPKKKKEKIFIRKIYKLHSNFQCKYHFY